MDWNEIGKWALAALGALAAAGIVFKLAINRKSSSTKVVQKGNFAGGDIVAGNKTTNSNNKKN